MFTIRRVTKNKVIGRNFWNLCKGKSIGFIESVYRSGFIFQPEFATFRETSSNLSNGDTGEFSIEKLSKEDRKKYAPKQVTPQGDKEPEKESGGLLDTILGFFKGGLLSGIMKIFSPANLLKVLGKVFVLTAIFASLFQGITAGFEKWKETGSLKDAIIAGLGGIVDFLTFGLFGEDNVKKMFDAVEGFITPIIQSIADVVTSMKDWVANNIGIPKISLGTWFGKER